MKSSIKFKIKKIFDIKINSTLIELSFAVQVNILHPEWNGAFDRSCIVKSVCSLQLIAVVISNINI